MNEIDIECNILNRGISELGIRSDCNLFDKIQCMADDKNLFLDNCVDQFLKIARDNKDLILTDILFIANVQIQTRRNLI